MLTVPNLLKAVLRLLGLQRREGGRVHIGGRLHRTATGGVGNGHHRWYHRLLLLLLLLVMQRLLLDVDGGGGGGGGETVRR